MRKIVVFLLLYFFLSNVNVYAQDSLKVKNKLKFSLGFKGQFALTSDFNTNVFCNFGGPGLLLTINKVGFQIGMYPSVRFYEEGKFSPLLGAGGQLSYKNFVAPIVFYNINSQADPSLLLTFGLGYKF